MVGESASWVDREERRILFFSCCGQQKGGKGRLADFERLPALFGCHSIPSNKAGAPGTGWAARQAGPRCLAGKAQEGAAETSLKKLKELQEQQRRRQPQVGIYVLWPLYDIKMTGKVPSRWAACPCLSMWRTAASEEEDTSFQGSYLDTGLSKLFPLVPPVVARCIDHTCILHRQVVADWAGSESAWQQPEPEIMGKSMSRCIGPPLCGAISPFGLVHSMQVLQCLPEVLQEARCVWLLQGPCKYAAVG